MKPMRLNRKSWRQRWLQFDSGVHLHRVAEIRWDDRDRIRGIGTSVCGRFGPMSMPGMLSRLEAPRCRQCCRSLRIEPGAGNPYNSDVDV